MGVYTLWIRFAGSLPNRLIHRFEEEGDDAAIKRLLGGGTVSNLRALVFGDLACQETEIFRIATPMFYPTVVLCRGERADVREAIARWELSIILERKQ